LPDDYASIAGLLDRSPDDVAARVADVALQAAAEWEWYGIEPPLPPQLTSAAPAASG
jgi:hypothetical protein